VIRIGSVGTEDGGVCDIGDVVDAADERDRGCGTAFAGAGIPGMWGVGGSVGGAGGIVRRLLVEESDRGVESDADEF